MVRRCLITSLCICLVTVPVYAADGIAAASSETRVQRSLAAPATTRGVLLPMLYVGLAALQTYDGISTSKSLSLGAVEANPLMRGVASDSFAHSAGKGATTAASIWAAERLWRQKHRLQAIVLMVGTNGLITAVAAHNTSVMRSFKK